jgi:hypothetical protein
MAPANPTPHADRLFNADRPRAHHPTGTSSNRQIIQPADHPTAIRSKLTECGIRLIGDPTLGTVADASKTRG